MIIKFQIYYFYNLLKQCHGYMYGEETELYYLRSRQDFFEKINGILGSNIDYSKFGPGEWKYNYKG